MLFSAAGGLALFLWGIRRLCDSLESSLAEKAIIFINRATGNPWKGFATGAIATLLLQSSSLTTVMVLSLINARVMSLRQAPGVIVGANVGTTITAHLLSFELHRMALPLFAIGFILSITPFICLRRWGKIISSFAIVLLGFNFMVEGFSPLGESGVFTEYLEKAGVFIWRGIGTGFISTVILQSSSALIGMAIALVQHGSINLQAAVALILGGDVGTCVTALIASLNTGKNARRAALYHLAFNLVSLFLVVPWFGLFIRLSEATSTETVRQLANAHTLYNLWAALFMLPFIHLYLHLSEKKGSDIL